MTMQTELDRALAEVERLRGALDQAMSDVLHQQRSTSPGTQLREEQAACVRRIDATLAPTKDSEAGGALTHQPSLPSPGGTVEREASGAPTEEAPQAPAPTYAQCVEAAAQARAEVDEWPEWKRNLSRKAPAPSEPARMCRTCRVPIDQPARKMSCYQHKPAPSPAPSPGPRDEHPSTPGPDVAGALAELRAAMAERPTHRIREAIAKLTASSK